MTYSKLLFLTLIFVAMPLHAQTPENFKRENLVAWCIVPFDAKKRDAHDRASMLKELGLRRSAYDWRQEHVPFFEDEIEQYKAFGIEYFAFWGQHDQTSALFEKHRLQPQLWQMIPDVGTGEPEELPAIAVEKLMPVVEKAASQGCRLGLYNHGGWGGEPENMVAVCKLLHAAGHTHVGIVYNMHHGHGHIADFAESLEIMQPYLHCLNINGMVDLNSPTYRGKSVSHKILPVGAGDHETEMIQTIIVSGYNGPIGILGHVAERDVAEVLKENIEGLEWILGGGEKPKWLQEREQSEAEMETEVKADQPLVEIEADNNAFDARTGFLSIEAPQQFNQGNFQIECRAKFLDRSNFNILLAKNPKSSFNHWEFYSYAATGNLSFYAPGVIPSEIKSEFSVADGKWHDLAVKFELDSDTGTGTVTLLVDDDEVRTQNVDLRKEKKSSEGPLTIGGLASRQFGCNGLIDFARISSLAEHETDSKRLDAAWTFDGVSESDQIGDESPSQRKTSFVPTHLDSDYLSKWTPKHRKDSRFPYENETDADWVDDRFSRMDTGPFFCQSIRVPGRGVVPKAIAVKAQGNDGAHLILDSETLNIKAAWSGEFVALPPTRFGILQTPSVAGALELTGPKNATWMNAGDWTPVDSLHLSAITLQGHKTGFSYDVAGESLTEYPSAKMLGDVCVVTRKFPNPSSKKSFAVPLFEVSGNMENVDVVAGSDAESEINETTHVFKDNKTAFVLRTNSGWKNRDGQVWLTLSGDENRQSNFAAVRYAKMPLDKLPDFLKAFGGMPDVALESNERIGTEDFAQKRWGDPIATEGIRSDADKPFVIDTITVPYQNQFNALMFTSGLDFLPDGRAAVCTVHGDVWLVSGIDDDLKNISWQRFATGLYQPLGLKIIDSDEPSKPASIFVLCRDRILELRDLNTDGEADVYANYCDELKITGQNHGYAMSLESDPEGNFYFIKSGSTPPHGGSMLKVDHETRKLSVFATGYRHANGLGVSPTGMVTSADNEGNWVPSTRIDAVQEGGFYGHMPTHWQTPPPTTYDLPMMWMPRSMDNSAGGQAWINGGDQWGRLDGAMIHFSFGRCSANVVMPQKTEDGTYQAAAYKLDLPNFLSGAMRGRFRAKDQCMYVCGLDGWQTAAIRDGCLQRIRATGIKFCLPVGFNVDGNEIEIAFSQPLDPKSANEVDKWKVDQWNYRWTADYGSEHYSVSDPDRIGHDPVVVQSVKLNEDKTKVSLLIENLKPVMQMNIRGEFKSATGEPLTVNLFNTINRMN